MTIKQFISKWLWLVTFFAWGGEISRGVPPTDHWLVVSEGPLDARIKKQITALASRQGAAIQFRQATSASESGRSHLTIELLSARAETSWSPVMDREGYVLHATYPDARRPASIRIRAKSPAGFHHGLLRIQDLLRLQPSDGFGASMIPAPQRVSVTRAGDAVTVSIEDFPSFPERGIVEGFYGKPWSHEARLGMLRFEGEHGMNVYYYAPKDDAYHRHRWRTPYPAPQYRRLGSLVKSARDNFVDFCFAVSPGLSIRYSSEQDFQQLTNKLASVAQLGVSCFALFLDDVPPELQDEADRAEFTSLAQAHASLINRLHDHLRAKSQNNRLVVTPTTYTSSWGKRDYIHELGALVKPGIPMVWTGIDTFSPVITKTQAEDWGTLIRRPPLVWDNFPVNDAEPWRIFIGPLTGRAQDLPEATQGFFANPMIQPRASMIPLATVADYLWNPRAYHPAQSLARAVHDQYGDEGGKILEPFLTTYADYRWDDNLFTPLFYSRRYAFDPAAIEERLVRLERALGQMSSHPKLQPLAEELSPTVPRTRRRLAEVLASDLFDRLPDGRLAPREDYDTIEASRLSDLPTLDGGFSKWEAGRILTLDQRDQVMRGASVWKGPAAFSARAAIRWDREYLYVGVNVRDQDLYQPAVGRGIEEGDVVILTVQTAFRKNYAATTATGDEYRFYFSPGNFGDIPPSLFSNEDYLPPRRRPHDHEQEIRTAWSRTPDGYSGDIAIPASYFDSGEFNEGYEIGLGVAVQNLTRGGVGRKGRNGLEKVVLISKKSSLYPVYLSNPSSYPRLVLVQ